MTERRLAALYMVVALTWLAPAGSAAQSQDAAVEDWTLSYTTWGDPDLQGVWSFATLTPLERPVTYAGRERLSAEEVVALNAEALTRGDQPPPRSRRLQRVLVRPRRVDRAHGADPIRRRGAFPSPRANGSGSTAASRPGARR